MDISTAYCMTDITDDLIVKIKNEIPSDEAFRIK